MTQVYIFTLWVLVLIIGFIGWVLNIIKLLGLLHEAQPDALWVIVRIVGIPLALLGAILGYTP